MSTNENARSTTRTVHVHGAEVSTDRESLTGYAETLALLVAITAFLAAAWIAAEPRADADMMIPAPPAPAVADFTRAADSTDDVVAPDIDAASSTGVTIVGAEFAEAG